MAINVEGTAVERELEDQTVLPMMHGFYRFGAQLAGAGVGMALTALSVPANIHIILARLPWRSRPFYRHSGDP